MAKGFLYVNVYVDNIAQPLKNASVLISGNDTNINTTTNENGSTDLITLDTVDRKYTESFQTDIRPYYTYTVTVDMPMFDKVIVNNVQILDSETSIQNIFLSSKKGKNIVTKLINISDISTWYTSTPSNNTLEEQTIMAKVLPEIVIPEYLIVHDGIPTDSNAPNYFVSFTDYIKNVASSEIYSTWPIETLKANIYCIISFTLNRVYTEWYKSKGYNFTITSSPAYDQKYVHGRNIFLSISNVVDEVFARYIRRVNKKEPLLALYNDGKFTNNPGWFSQWGSKELGDSGMNAFDIVKYYYGTNILLEEAKTIEGLPTSYPGFNLSLDSCGESVQKVQNELNYIHGSYPGIPIIPNADGTFKEETKKAVETFQEVFKLPVTGIVDYSTWYKISHIYIAVSKMISGINN